MRSISANGLAKLAQNLGTEPISIVEVFWGDSPMLYADRDVGSIPGRIIEVANLDNVIDIQSSNSQSISLILDDTDGSIKQILDTQDIHQRPVNVYQHFAGLDLSDKFLLFRGKISSPITWSEADHTFTFQVVSQIEDKEIGFSAEEGQFPFLPRELVGKAWPMIFGKCLDVPALQVNKAVSGTTLCGVGILSGADLHNQVPLGGENCGTGMSIAMLSEQISLLNIGFASWRLVDAAKASQLQNQANELRAQITNTVNGNNTQKNCAQTKRAEKLQPTESEGCNPVRILGGEDFPQGVPIKLNINGGLFIGIMTGDSFFISIREHPDNDERAQEAFDSIEDSMCEQGTPAQHFDMSLDVPCGAGNFFNGCQVRRFGFIICSLPSRSRPSINQVAEHFWAEPGSRVVIASDEPITYIVSITPGTVLAVKAFKEFNGLRTLVNVPNELWTVQVVNYGTVTATQIVLSKPLSSIPDQGWSDDIYVTFENPLSNPVDILDYIILNYTSLSRDATSFLAARTALLNFPMNFAILDRRNTLDVINKLAYAARCAVWLSNDVFFLKYLPAEPTADDTITISDIEASSVEMELTSTEDLITKLTATWRLSWAGEPEHFILRNNVAKYGTKEDEIDLTFYNQPDTALKVATFWLIRKSNTWKRLRFRTFLNKLNLETFDTVNLDLPPYVSSSVVKAVVEKADYSSADQSLNFECWVPVIVGEMVKNKFAWPAALSVVGTGDAFAFTGGGGIGAGATGSLPIGFTDGIGQGGTVFVGGPNVVFRAQSDRGDRTPGDSGFVAQTIIPNNVFAEVVATPNPRPDLTLNFLDPPPAPIVPPLPDGGISVDIRRTKIIDSQNPNQHAFLSTIFRKISQDRVFLDTQAQFSDGTNDKQFDFKFDEEGGKFGAGTAFLQD